MSSMRTFKTHLYNILTVIENKLTDWSTRQVEHGGRNVDITNFIYLWVPNDNSSDLKLTLSIADTDKVFRIQKSEWNSVYQYIVNSYSNEIRIKSENKEIVFFKSVGDDAFEFSYEELFWRKRFRAERASVLHAINVCREYGYI